MAINITPEDIASRINGFQLSDRSIPSTDTVSETIAEEIAYVTMLVASKGVIVDSPSTQETYLRGLVIRLVCAKVELMRNRATSSFSLDVQDKAMAELNAFLSRAANLANADTGNVDKPASNARPPCCPPKNTPINRWRRGGKL